MNVLLLKVASYGGRLSFELQYSLLSDQAQSYFDADVELIVSIVSFLLNVHFSLLLCVVIVMTMAKAVNWQTTNSVMYIRNIYSKISYSHSN